MTTASPSKCNRFTESPEDIFFSSHAAAVAINQVCLSRHWNKRPTTNQPIRSYQILSAYLMLGYVWMYGYVRTFSLDCRDWKCFVMLCGFPLSSNFSLTLWLSAATLGDLLKSWPGGNCSSWHTVSSSTDCFGMRVTQVHVKDQLRMRWRIWCIRCPQTQDDWDRTLQTIGTHISIPQFSAFLMPCPVASAALSMVCMMCSLSCGTDACASWILSLDKPSKSSRRPRPEANRAERKASFSLAEQDKWYNMKQAGFQWLRFTW